LDLIKRRYDSTNECLFNDEEGNPMTYDKYRGRFDKVNKKLNMKHMIQGTLLSPAQKNQVLMNTF